MTIAQYLLSEPNVRVKIIIIVYLKGAFDYKICLIVNSGKGDDLLQGRPAQLSDTTDGSYYYKMYSSPRGCRTGVSICAAARVQQV